MDERLRRVNLRSMPLIPPGIRFLLVANAALFLLTLAAKALLDFQLIEYLGLYHPTSEKFGYHQFISHLFMHGSGLHIFMNMFILWMFGGILEHVWGLRKFMLFFVLTGLGAALIHNGVRTIQINQLETATQAYLQDPSLERFKQYQSAEIGAVPRSFQKRLDELTEEWKANPESQQLRERSKTLVKDYKSLYRGIPTVGASGAVYGLLMAFGLLFPNIYVYLYLLIPIRAKYFVVILILLQLYLGFFYKSSNVANFAHLGGMLVGYVLLKLWDEKPVVMVRE
jgi:membrane associated rhomboid family serine protease